MKDMSLPWRWAMVGPALFVAHVGAAVGDVIGTSGLVATQGPAALLALWLFDAFLTLVAAGAVAQVVDRVDRSVLLRGAALACAALAIVYAVLVGGDHPRPAAFFVVAVGERLQQGVLYYAGWALARDAFGADVRRLAQVRVLTTVGQLSGAALAGAVASLGVSRAFLFVPLGVTFLVVERVVAHGAKTGRLVALPVGSSMPPPAMPAFASLRPATLQQMQAAAEETPPDDEPRGLRHALGQARRSRHVRLLLALGLLNGVGYTVLAYELARLLGVEAAQGVQGLEVRYGVLRALEPAAYALAELFVAPFCIKRAGIVPVLALTPAVLLGALAWLWAVPLASIGIVGSTVLQASFGVEAPALSAAIATLPARVRGRIGVLLDATPYTFGYIAAIVVLGALLAGERLLGLGSSPARLVAAVFGVVTSVLGIVVVRRLLALGRGPAHG